MRILVDGYSLLHSLPELAPGKSRFCAAARDELIAWLTSYQDAVGTPVTVVFDGGMAPSGLAHPHSTPEMEVLFSRDGKTADDIIERVAFKLQDYGECLVITDDYAERDVISSMGGFVWSCERFIESAEAVFKDSQREWRRRNERELRSFKR